MFIIHESRIGRYFNLSFGNPKRQKLSPVCTFQVHLPFPRRLARPFVFSPKMLGYIFIYLVMTSIDTGADISVAIRSLGPKVKGHGI